MNKQERTVSQIQSQRKFFKTGQTKKLSFRLNSLKKLKEVISTNEKEILKTLNQDLGRCDFESYIIDINIVLNEIDYALKNLPSWVTPKSVRMPWQHFPASGWIVPEPYGIALLISPWNAPCQLLFNPLIGAITAGNCVVLKPSEISAHTSELMIRLINETFQQDYIVAIQGGAEESKILLDQQFDYIFFMGSASRGKLVMQAAAKYLTPVTLELGGKSPCIVDKNIKIDTVARRLMWGKTINAGQICMAPDYLLVHSDIKEELLLALKNSITKFYGSNPTESPHFCRIINQNHFERLSGLLSQGKIIAGGQLNQKQKYIAPTIIDEISWDSKIMQEEIFGPILPVICYTNLDDAIKIINAREKPLAIYLFSNDEKIQQKVIKNTSSGTICINDVIVHSALKTLPFGGVGQSGIGRYHGKASFDTFSNNKSIMKKSLMMDPSLRYPPYPELNTLLKWILRKLD